MVELSFMATLITWARAFAPANGMVKLSGFICSNTVGPTCTATGMVTLSPDVWNSNWPTNVPTVDPPPGRLALLMLMAILDGAVPLEGEAANQPLPIPVLAVTVQFSVPDPVFRI